MAFVFQVKMEDLEQRCEAQTAEQGKLLEELEALKIKAEQTQNEHLKAMEELKVSSAQNKSRTNTEWASQSHGGAQGK